MTPSRELTHAEVCKLFNQFADEGGAKVRWNEELRGYTTYEGDRYPDGTVEDVARGLWKPSDDADQEAR